MMRFVPDDKTLPVWACQLDGGYPPPPEAWYSAPRLAAEDSADAADLFSKRLGETKCAVWVWLQKDGEKPERVEVETLPMVLR